MKNREKAIFLLIFFVAILSSISGYAKGEKDTLKVLFVGNSYTHVNNLPQIVSILSHGVKVRLITKESTAGGAKLREHWLGGRGLKTKEKIKNGNFDFVVLQGHSMSTIREPDSLSKYSKLFCDYIRMYGAEPVFYLTWAREKVPQLQETINKVYYSIAAKNKAKVIPAGKAWALAEKLRPGIELFQIDGSHPSKLGTVLTADVFVASLTNEIPPKILRGYMINDINGEPIRLMYFYDQELLNLTFCEKIVEKIVQ